MQKLTPPEIQTALNSAPGWSLTDGKLERTFEFPDFILAMKFVRQVADIAEDENHHPDIDIRYNKVKLALVTHDAGGITANDAKVATRISKQFPR